MNIIAVDDERPALRMLEKAIRQAEPECSLTCFLTAMEAIEYAKEERVDVAFLDIRMAGKNGLEMARELREIYQKTNILFVTGYQEYALDAFALAASDYIMKPAKPEDISAGLDNLRYGVKRHPEPEVRIKCFGGFGVFVDGKPLLFPRVKTKELLAYLVHKQGAVANTAEIAAVLWEDKAYTHSVRTQTQKAIGNLLKLLQDAGIGYIVERGWNSMAVDVEKFSCDFYEHLKEDNNYISINSGEYMNEYSWGEFVAGYLHGKKK